MQNSHYFKPIENCYIKLHFLYFINFKMLLKDVCHWKTDNFDFIFNEHFLRNYRCFLLIILLWRRFFGTIKSRKVKILRLIYFGKISAHLFEDFICKNKLERFIFLKNFFQRTSIFKNKLILSFFSSVTI